MGLASRKMATPVEMSKVKEFVDLLLNTKRIVVFSKTYCPYCHMAKKALTSLPLKDDAMEWVEINVRDDCDTIQDYMHQLTGARTVPRVFINGKFFGGGTDTEAARKDGRLQKMLESVGALSL